MIRDYDFLRDLLRSLLIGLAIWIVALTVAALVFVALVRLAHAHDEADWIRQQSLKNRLGEYCCGPIDCSAVDPARVHETAAGYLVDGAPGGPEIIPYSEAMPFSPDGRLWICRAQDGHRRCVFNRPPAM